MKKMLKIIGGVLLVIVILLAGMFIYLNAKPAVPNKYWEKISSDASIENKYNNLGSYEVTKSQYDAVKDERDENDNHYVVWYPKQEGTYPLIVMVNGTGVPCDKYEEVFRHFASWGYVVIGNDYGTNWDGVHASETLDFALNNPEISQMIDMEKIAIGGHSQGGIGTFNAVNEYENGSYYKVMFAISPTSTELSLALQWGFQLESPQAYAYKPENVAIPTLLIAGTGSFDSETVIPLEQMNLTYNKLTNDKVMFRRNDNIDHGDMLYEANGYIIAWLDYYLKDVTENANAFFGQDAEIAANSRYCDFKSEQDASQ
ncbi:MAG: alpha/beta hydrolase family protein [Erysipelotrichaceae bacterium]